ncbi:hypothetical protein PFISCL1PPCAC_6110, partial [Pristionchus fissidentatus]
PVAVMEVDPTSTGDSDVGGSGTEAALQPPLEVPVEAGADDTESLRKERAELDREIFTIKAELEAMTGKFLAAVSKNDEINNQYSDLNRQYEERQRLFRDLQVVNETLLTQKGTVAADCLTAKRERDEKELLLKRVNKEKQLIAVEVQSLKEQLKNLSSQKMELEMQRRDMERAQQDARLECQRAADEKAVYEESKRWFMNELADRDNKISQLRLEFSGKEVSWQNERMRLVGDKTSAMNEVEDIRVDLSLKQRMLDESNEKLKGIAESHDAQLMTLRQEVSSRECLVRTLKDQIKMADEASNQMKSLYDGTAALLESAREEIEAARVDTARQIEEATRVIEERDREVAELKDELDKANELLKNKHNLTLSDEAIEELSPAAAAASRLIKSGGSLTAIYREHAKLAAQLEEEREKSRLTEESFQEVIGDLTERAPQLIQQKERLEQLTDENYRLTRQLEEADEQRKKLLEDRDQAKRQLAFNSAELEKFQRDYQFLTDKVTHLVFALEKERERAKNRRAGEEDEEEADEEEDRALFRDVKSLTRRNVELESELSMERAKGDKMAEEKVREATSLMNSSNEELQRDLEKQRAFCLRLETALESKQQSLESYKNIVEGGLGGENSITKRKLEQKTSDLNEAQMKISRLEEWMKSEKEEKAKLTAVYEERFNQHIALASELKRVNAKLESDFGLQKQTALESYKELEKKTRQIEKLVDGEQKARQQVVAVEQKVISLNANMMEMQSELSRSRMDKRTLRDQLLMSQGNEMRLKAELDARHANSQHNEMMVSMMGEMEARVKAVESSRTEVMEMRVENLESERDQLKTSNASLAERNERLQREHRDDSTKFELEKTELKSKLDTEKSERISAENMANELRAKLVATQQHFTTVDASIGSNPERLAQECQKLKNENKFLEGQLDELKKRTEVADAAAKKAEDELSKLTVHSSTVESTLVDSTRSGSLEKERLQGLLEAEILKANNLESEMSRLKKLMGEMEETTRAAEIAADAATLEMAQTLSVMEMRLSEETAKGTGFDDRMRGVVEEKEAVVHQLSLVEEQLNEVKGELEEIMMEKENVITKAANLQTELSSMESRLLEESTRWMEEKSAMEGAAKNLKIEEETMKKNLEDELKRKEEQLQNLVSMAREVDGSTSMDVEGVSQMTAVNRYLREEQQRSTERMMRAEVEMKRMKVQSDELEGERIRLEKKIRELEAKAESDAVELKDMAELRMKLETSMQIERELGGMKEEKERMNKTVAEMQRRLTLMNAEKAKNLGELKTLRETNGSLTAENGGKTREIALTKKLVMEKEQEIAKLRAELATATKQAETAAAAAAAAPPMGGPARMRAQLEAMQKRELELQNEINALRKKGDEEVEKLNGTIVQLRSLARKYKQQTVQPGGSLVTGSDADMIDAPTASSDQGVSTPPSSIAFKRLQEMKDELERKLNELTATKEELEKKLTAMTAAKDAAEAEKDEIKFRTSSIHSMLQNSKQQKDALTKENAELKKRLSELGEALEESAPPSQSTSAAASPLKTVVPLVSSGNVTQSTPQSAPVIPQPSSIKESSPQKAVVPAVATVPSSLSSIPTVSSVPAVSSIPSLPSTSIPSAPVVSSLPSVPSVPTPAPTTNMFGSGTINWPDKMSRVSASSSSTSTLSTGRLLFGHSAGPSHFPDVSTSTSTQEESREEEEQPISSSVDSRKRGASDDRVETKRARVEEEEEDEDDASHLITSSHRGGEMDEMMVEEDTRDGEGEGEGEEETTEKKEDVVEEEDSGDVVVIDDDEEEEGDDGEDEEEDEGEYANDEDDSQRDDEMDDLLEEGRAERAMGQGGVDEEDDEVEDVSSDEDDDDEEEDEDDEEEELDRGSESDGEVEGEGEGEGEEGGEEGEERDEGREAIASIDEADEECRSPAVAESCESVAVSRETGEGGGKPPKKKSPIRFVEVCSSSNESGRPSTSSVPPSRGGRGATRGVARSARAPDLATNLMRGLGRGNRGGPRPNRGGPRN